jgi:hypothetical protein
VVAVVLLGAFVGLNVRRIGPRIMVLQLDRIHHAYYQGWPLPFTVDLGSWQEENEDDKAEFWKWAKQNSLGATPLAELNEFDAQFRWVPWSHQSYRIIAWQPLQLLDARFGFILWGALDALFALTGVALILFLQIPRRKAPEPVQSIPAPSRR